MTAKCGRPETPALTVDCVIVDSRGRVLLIRRANPPFPHAYALPGGFVEIGETVEDAGRREVFEETAVKVGRLSLIGVYSDPKRDPRGHTCSVAFLARVTRTAAVAGDDAGDVTWVADWRRHRLAFDHARIVADAFAILRRRTPGKERKAFSGVAGRKVGEG